MKQFFLHRWFLLALVGVIVMGARFSGTLAPLLAVLPRWWESALIAAMMFLMALPLEAGMMGRALRRPAATLLGVAAAFLVAPAVALGISVELRHVLRALAIGLLNV